MKCLPNCGTTGIKGVIYDANGSPISGDDLRVKVWTDSWEGALSPIHNGHWEILLSPGPIGGNWYVAVLDANGEMLIDYKITCSNGPPAERIAPP